VSDTYRLELKHVEYWDLTQRWTVDFKDRVVARNLVSESWNGSTDAWSTRLAEIEKIFLEHYAKATSPRARTEPAPALGIRIVDPSHPLYVVGAIEEQLMALLLLRLNGRSIATLWVDATGKYPERVIAATGQLIERLTRMCEGDLAPAAAMARKDRTVKNAEWNFAHVAVPTFTWTGGDDFVKGRRVQIAQARRRLGEIVTRSKSENIRQDEWDEAIRKELAAINGLDESIPERLDHPAINDLLAPRLLAYGTGLFDYAEKLVTKEGVVESTRVEVIGRAQKEVVAFYDVSANCWRVGEAQYDVWFKASVNIVR